MSRYAILIFIIAIMATGGARSTAESSVARSKALPLFAHPREITHPYLPLGTLRQDVLEGKDGDKKLRVERTLRTDLHRGFTVAGQVIETLVVESRAFEDGKPAWGAMEYFAQAEDVTVYHLGKGVDQYVNGQVAGHAGSWLLPANARTASVALPALPMVGDKFQIVDVPKSVREEDEVVSVTEKVTVPAGTFANCIQIKAVLADGKIVHRYYAAGVGCVKEAWDQGDLLLTKRTTRVAFKPNSRQDADPLARVALRFVGADARAERYWLAAINNPGLSAHERSNLIEDLNEDGLSDPKRPGPGDLPLIMNRIRLIERVAPFAMDQVNADAFKEAYKDLTNMAGKLMGQAR